MYTGKNYLAQENCFYFGEREVKPEVTTLCFLLALSIHFWLQLTLFLALAILFTCRILFVFVV